MAFARRAVALGVMTLLPTSAVAILMVPGCSSDRAASSSVPAGEGGADADVAPSEAGEAGVVDGGLPAAEDTDCTRAVKLCPRYLTTPVCIAEKKTCGCRSDAECVVGYHCEPAVGPAGTCEPGCVGSDGGAHCSASSTCDMQANSSGQPRCINPNLLACSTACATGYVCDQVAAKCIPECDDPKLREPGMLTCVTCVTDPDCASSATGPRCLPGDAQRFHACGCALDSDCGGPRSGMVCAEAAFGSQCEPGCRVDVGNGCPVGMVCDKASSSASGHCKSP